ncbi:DUF1579 family protein [uncultured Algimonas sp.]|uniref:DUF1579 family protein n=1 Tax=uncultured Algimonas sp. TaxID=1547920 RepID=UPI0026383FD9|nr:DUF1579 family protein [uncultured Algimonas sp.]
MTRSFMLGAMIVGAMATYPLAAADETEAADAPVHPVVAAMAELKPLMGEFVVTGTQNEADGSVTPHVPSRATGEATVGKVGLLLKTAVNAGYGQPITTHVTLAYDQYRNVYRIAVLDNMSGLLDIYEGTVEDGVLSADNLRTDTYYMNGDMKVHFRLVWDMTGPVIDYDVDASIDGGETWMPYMMMEMTPTDT